MQNRYRPVFLGTGTRVQSTAPLAGARFRERAVRTRVPALELLAQPLLPLPDRAKILLAPDRPELGEHPHVVRGVLHMDDRPAVQRRELDGRMQVGGRRPADQNRDAEPHLLDRHDHLGHFLERRGNQSAQSDHVGLLPNRRLDDPLALDHHAEIFHPIPVAGQHDRDDVLPDVVHVALDGSQHHAPGGRGAALAAFGFDVGRQYGDGPLHHPRALDHLRQEHLALAEQLAYAVHAAHQRALDHGERIAQFAVSFLGILVHIVGDTFQHRMGEPFGHRSRAPPQSFAVVGGRSLLILDLLGIGRQTLGRIRPRASTTSSQSSSSGFGISS